MTEHSPEPPRIRTQNAPAASTSPSENESNRPSEPPDDESRDSIGGAPATEGSRAGVPETVQQAAARSSRTGRVRGGVSATSRTDTHPRVPTTPARSMAPELPEGASQEARYAPTMELTIDRLVREVTLAVEDGDNAVPEVSRLYTWLHAECLPWTLAVERDFPDAEPVAITTVRADRAELADLASRLRGAHGMEGALVAHDVRLRSALLFAHLRDLWAPEHQRH